MGPGLLRHGQRGAQASCLAITAQISRRKVAHLCMKKISKIFNPVSLDRESLIRFCFQAFLVTTIGAIVVTAFTQGLMQAIGVKNTRLTTEVFEGFNIKDFLGVVIFAPVVETFILGLFIKIVSFFSTCRIIVCGVGAVVAAIFHANTNGAYHFFGPLILFFSFSYSFVLWRVHSYRFAYIAACVPHILNNFLLFLVAFLLESLLLLI